MPQDVERMRSGPMGDSNSARWTVSMGALYHPWRLVRRRCAVRHGTPTTKATGAASEAEPHASRVASGRALDMSRRHAEAHPRVPCGAPRESEGERLESPRDDEAPPLLARTAACPALRGSKAPRPTTQGFGGLAVHQSSHRGR